MWKVKINVHRKHYKKKRYIAWIILWRLKRPPKIKLLCSFLWRSFYGDGSFLKIDNRGGFFIFFRRFITSANWNTFFFEQTHMFLPNQKNWNEIFHDLSLVSQPQPIEILSSVSSLSRRPISVAPFDLRRALRSPSRPPISVVPSHLRRALPSPSHPPIFVVPSPLRRRAISVGVVFFASSQSCCLCFPFPSLRHLLLW